MFLQVTKIAIGLIKSINLIRVIQVQFSWKLKLDKELSHEISRLTH
jgi:hypothetical protein